MKLSAAVKFAAFCASISAVQARRIAEGERKLQEFGTAGSMSVPSSGEIVQLAAFEGGEVDFGVPEEAIFTSSTTSTTTTMASSKADKPASVTSAKGSKQPTSPLGKSGKGGSRVYDNFISRSIPVRVQDTEGYSEMTVIQSGGGQVEVRAWCDNNAGSADMGFAVYILRGSEAFEFYGQIYDMAPSIQDVDPPNVSGIIPAWDGTGNRMYEFTFFAIENGSNNNPDFGAITFVGQTSGTRFYVGVDGSSTVAVETSDTPYTCDITGVVMTNFANTLEEPFYVNQTVLAN